MTKFITLLEWSFGLISLGLAGLAFFFVMFTDSPGFHDKLSAIQQGAFTIYYGVALVLFGVVIGSFILQFIFKHFPWAHLVGSTGLLSFIYFYIFFSAYSTKS